MPNTVLQKIMYVEDEPDIIAIARIALSDMGGFIIRSCTSGREALKNAVAFNPDLFLIDVMMPDMDGIATLTELRKIPTLAFTPAIFITARMQHNEVSEYFSLGVIDVIAKPFDPMTLANKIKQAWENSRRKYDV